MTDNSDWQLTDSKGSSFQLTVLLTGINRLNTINVAQIFKTASLPLFDVMQCNFSYCFSVKVTVKVITYQIFQLQFQLVLSGNFFSYSYQFFS